MIEFFISTSFKYVSTYFTKPECYLYNDFSYFRIIRKILNKDIRNV